MDRLPALAGVLLDEWELAPDGAAWHGHCSLVLPVTGRTGERQALKITFDGDDESRHEALALQHWGGHGVVRLVRADPGRRALLLERLHERDLADLDDTAACEVLGDLYGRIRRPAPPQLATVGSYVGRWVEPLAALPRDAPLPHRLVDQARHLAADLLAAPPERPVIVHGDLHQHNVLAADREPWLVIDPKPMAGDQHYEPAPALWNCWERLVAAGDVRAGVRHRFHTLVDTAGLDEDLARDWVVVRMVVNASWSLQDAERERRALDAGERDWITRCIAIAKAVQD
nr:aminoglycoside phosphotransferase family protein [Nocardioides luti]